MQYKVVLHLELEISAESAREARDKMLDIYLNDEVIQSNITADVIGFDTLEEGGTK